MKTVFNKSVFALILAAGLLTGCVTEDDYDTPTLDCAENYLTTTLEAKDVPAPVVATKYPKDDIISAYVVSSDVEGNFFKSISLQTLDGSFGFSVPVDVTSVFAKMEPGRLVFIKLNDDFIYTDKKYGSLRIGALFGNQVGRLSPADFRDVIVPSCTAVKEDVLVRKMPLSQVKNDANINTLIDIEDVQFSNEAVGDTYYDDNNALGGATNHNLRDKNGNTLIFRTSEFTTYADHKVPGESGTVRGILTKFENTYQFIARTEADIKLTKTRF